MFFTKYEYFMYFLVSRFFASSGLVHILGFVGLMTGPVLKTLALACKASCSANSSLSVCYVITVFAKLQIFHSLSTAVILTFHGR